MTQPVSSVTAVLPKDTVYTVNDSDVKVVDGRPSLLVDEIVSTDNSASGSDYRGVLVDKAVKLVGEGFQNVATQAKYLDLVDAANGNTWIQTDSNVTIYWPYPQGTDANTKFRLVHFDGLDREMTADEVMDAINKNEPVVVKDLVTDQYGIRFETDSFSPFVLVWDNTQTTMYVMITLSLNLMVGYMGQMSFGHAAFMGIGAYTAAILTTTYDVPFFVAFILAGVVAGLFGLLLGLPVLKLKGYYFTIITMVFCEIVRVVELNWMSLTRGPLGIMAIPKPSFLGFEITTPRQFYFMILVLVALSTLVVSNLMKSRVGYAILAIRDDELAAEAMGIHVFRYKMIVFILSSLLVGLAGAFYATYTSYIDPSSFAAAQSNDMLVMVIFGGLGNTVGSFIGAISLSILPEALRDLAQYRQLIYGVLLVLLMMVKPQGLLGDINFKYIRQRMEHREKSKEAANE